MIKLPRLPLGYEKNPGLFPRYWDEAMTGIEKALNQVLLIPGIQDAIDAANAAAVSANAAADNAQASADAQSTEMSLVNSYIDTASFSGALISCDEFGEITIQNHTRVYGDGSSVSVTGDIFTVSGVVMDDVIRVFYDDPTRSGGSVVYTHTVDPDPSLAQTGDTHSVGSVSVPLSGSLDGRYITPPGYVYYF